jgi:hypothetical protein
MRIVETNLLARLIVGAGVLASAVPSAATTQERRLEGRLPDEQRAQVDSVLAVAQAENLPTEPLVDRALEGAAKGAPGDLIVRAVVRLAGELQTAQAAFGGGASPGELTAGASAIRAGASQSDLAELRERRAGELTVAAAVLADLVAVGVPSDTAISAVLALASGLADSDYVAFRRNVERDIELGASPAGALDVRLRVAAGMAGDALSAEAPGGAQRTPPGRRKP